MIVRIPVQPDRRAGGILLHDGRQHPGRRPRQLPPSSRHCQVVSCQLSPYPNNYLIVAFFPRFCRVTSCQLFPPFRHCQVMLCRRRNVLSAVFFRTKFVL